MNQQTPMQPPAAAPPAGAWGHLLVSASACLLTVSIVGSAVFLASRLYNRYETRARIREFISSLENRTPEELDGQAAKIQDRPKLQEQILPELTRTMRSARSEEQLCAAIRLSKPFLNHKRVRDALFELRADGRERVAGAAIAALSAMEPPEDAVDTLVRCLKETGSGVLCPAAVDQLCSGLVRLGSSALEKAAPHINNLTPERRLWLVGYLNTLGGPHRAAWLTLLASDSDPRVKSAAQSALANNQPSNSVPVARRPGTGD